MPLKDPRRPDKINDAFLSSAKFLNPPRVMKLATLSRQPFANAILTNWILSLRTEKKVKPLNKAGSHPRITVINTNTLRKEEGKTNLKAKEKKKRVLKKLSGAMFLYVFIPTHFTPTIASEFQLSN